MDEIAWEFERDGEWKAMSTNDSELLEESYVHDTRTVVMEIPPGEGTTPARRRYDLVLLGQYIEVWLLGEDGAAYEWNIFATTDIRRRTVWVHHFPLPGREDDDETCGLCETMALGMKRWRQREREQAERDSADVDWLIDGGLCSNLG